MGHHAHIDAERNASPAGEEHSRETLWEAFGIDQTRDPPQGEAHWLRSPYPTHYSCDREGRWPRTEAQHAALWARACADCGDPFDRFVRLLETDWGLVEWLEDQTEAQLFAIWRAPRYRRPEHWSDTIKGVDGCAASRWLWLCEPLRAEDRVWHEMPNGEEAAWVAALDYLKWKGTGQKRRKGRGPRPNISALPPKGARDAFFDQVHAFRLRWKDWKGAPWRVVANARAESLAAWGREWPRRRAGERLTFTPPDYSEEIRAAVWAPRRKRKAQ